MKSTITGVVMVAIIAAIIAEEADTMEADESLTTRTAEVTSAATTVGEEVTMDNSNVHRVFWVIIHQVITDNTRMDRASIRITKLR
jgi:hypothetical protein